MSGGEGRRRKETEKGRGSHGHPAVHIWHLTKPTGHGQDDAHACWLRTTGEEGKKGTKPRVGTEKTLAVHLLVSSTRPRVEKGERDASGMQQSRLSRLRFSAVCLCLYGLLLLHKHK